MSGHNLPDWFIPKYREEVTLRGQQMKRQLDNTTVDTGNYVGDECFFPRFGSVETYKSARLAALTLANAKMDWVKSSAEPEFVAFGIWDPDKKKLGPNAPGQFAGAAVRATNRAHDRQIVDAFADAAANGVVNTRNDAAENIVTIGDYNTVVDLETVVDAYQRIATNQLTGGSKVTMVRPMKVGVQLAMDPYMAKSDMKSNRPWDEIDFRTYEALPGNAADGTGILLNGATGVDMYMWAQEAVASSQNDGDTPIDERLAAQLADMMGQWFQATAKVLLPEGLIRIKSKLDFPLLRRAIPVDNIGN